MRPTKRVFISHSVAPGELALLNGVADIVAQRGGTPLIADRDWKPSEPLPPRIAALIHDADIFIALATHAGFQTEWVNKEIAYAQSQNPSLPILVVADQGVSVAPGMNVVRINRRDHWQTLRAVAERIRGMPQDEQGQQVLGWLLLGALILLLLKEGK